MMKLRKTLWLANTLVLLLFMQTSILTEGRSIRVEMKREQSKAALRWLRGAPTSTEGSPNQGDGYIYDDHDGHDHDGHDHDGHDHDGHDHDGHDHDGHDHDGHDHDGHDHDEEATEFANHQDDRKKPWGKVIGATLLVNLIALAGVLSLCCLTKKAAFFSSTNWIDISISSSAAGALLAAACFLILPESSVMLLETHTESTSGSGHEDHDHEGHEDHKAEVSWKFGVSILAGFLLPMIVGAFIPRPKDHKCDEKCGSRGDPVDLTCHSEANQEAKSCDTCSNANAQTSEEKNNEFEMEQVSNCNDECQKSNSSDANDVEESNNIGINDIETKPHVSFIESGRSTSLSDKVNEKIPAEVTIPIDWKLCSSILIGDAFHNFADGIFIGTAFMLCTTDIALSIVLVTVYHEIAQELADFVLLTKHAGLSYFAALALNFISGLSVMLGGVVVLAMDLSSQTIGAILALAAGVYINVAACECIPNVSQNLKTTGHQFLSILTFILGTIPIGLIMLNHHHC